MGSLITQIPYGQLANGKFGINLDEFAAIQPLAGQPLSSVVEVFATLPADGADDENFNGRLVFAIDVQTLFVFQADVGLGEWFPLEGIPAEVGLCSDGVPDPITGRPRPPVTGTEQTGFLFWCTDSEVMFVWDGSAWQPIGGRFAAQTRIITDTGDGATTTFAVGLTTATTSLTEAFLDGIRQLPVTDYSRVGNNVVFVVAPALGVSIFLQVLESEVLEGPQLGQNAQCINSDFPNQAASITDFDAGASGLDPACTMVFVNGALLIGGGVDYVHQSKDTTISTITNVGTLATVTTASAHSLATADEVRISGAVEPEYNGVFTITVTGLSTFTYTMSSDPGGSATTLDTLFYEPSAVNDVIVLNLATSLNDDVSIRSFQRIVTAPTTGEANDGANLGSGVGVFANKSGVDLRFKSLSAGANIAINDLGTEIEITGALGILFEGRSGINTPAYSVSSSDSYVGVLDTSAQVDINVSAEHASGRRIIITDESGSAGSPNSIRVVHAGATFNGAVSPFIINSNFGSVTIVAGQTNEWFIVSKTF